jgi:hypothetical protein
MFCNAIFEVDKFDGINYFHMWQCAIMDVLIQQELDITLEDKLVEMSKKTGTSSIDTLAAPSGNVWPRTISTIFIREIFLLRKFKCP